MKIVARIEKIESDRYVFGGRMFDSFLSARRAMVEEMRRRRAARKGVQSSVPRLAAMGA